MSDQQLDYHVGLIRGFVLAHNAPTIILHALDILLSNYRSKAGETIGTVSIKIPEFPPTAKNIAPVKINFVKDENKLDLGIAPIKSFIPDSLEDPKPKYFWDREDDDILRKAVSVDGKGPAYISENLLPHRSRASIATRMSVLKLSRKQPELI